MRDGELICASCGRTNDFGPDGAKPFECMSQLWCSYCACTDGRYLKTPTPGKMVSKPVNVLAAWQDCYDMKPEKRILRKDARVEIQRAWEQWDGDKSSSMAKLEFFGWLQTYRPYFLTFRGGSDKWQRVKYWVIEYEDKRDRSLGSDLPPST